MCDTKLWGMSEKWQGKATIQKDWRNSKQFNKDKYVLYLGQGMSLQAVFVG